MLHRNITPDNTSYVFVKFLEGDEAAFSFFYKHFIGDMYAYGRSFGIDQADVMDAVQDVFMKVYKSKPKLDSVEHLKFFLLRSLKNRLYDMFKSKSFSQTDEIDEDALTFSIETTVLDNIIEDEDQVIIARKIERLLALLTPLQKETLYLRYIKGLEYAEISLIMERSQDAVRKIVSDAILKIRSEDKLVLLLIFIELFQNNI